MSKFGGSISREKEVRKHMHQLKLFEKDIKESFVHSSGPGGQNVNKVATCVVLEHLPTGIRIKCKEKRTQAQNRYLARYLLIKEVEHRIKHQHVLAVQAALKTKRQNAKRPKFIKEEILKEKHKKSEKKLTRKKIIFRNIADEVKE